MTDLSRMLALLPEAFAAVDAALGHVPVKTLGALRRELLRWRDERHPHLTDFECERLARCLNRNFYALEDA